MLKTVTSFEWLSFFVGGAVGSLIILGIDRLIDFIVSRIQYSKEKEQIALALKNELEIILFQCKQILAFGDVPAAPFVDVAFDTTWIPSRFLWNDMQREDAKPDAIPIFVE
jgi:hypothetical protein